MVEKTFGVQLNPLATNFNYSPLKKRLKMITKNKSGNRLKWLYLLALPVFAAAFVLIACEQSTNKEVAEAVAENNNTTYEGEDVYFKVEEMPTFDEAVDSLTFKAFRNYIGQNLKYPEEAAEQGIQGRVFVQFWINKDGDVCNAVIARGVHELLDAEALRVINSSPKWTPGKQDGQPKVVQFTMPIVFTLQ